jgi:hypothetical protein
VTPAEEQGLRNDAAIMQMLSHLIAGQPVDESSVYALRKALQCMQETKRLLTIEDQKGGTVHDYADPS